MALKQEEIMKWGILGFVAAIFTGFILKFISQIVSLIPGVDLNLQATAVTTEGLGGVIGTGFGEFAQKLFGAVPIPLTMPDYIIAGFAGALFVIVGAYTVDAIKGLQFAKTKQGKLATVLVVAGIVSGWILSMSIGLPPLGGIIAVSVNAYILSFILIAVDENLKTKLIP